MPASEPGSADPLGLSGVIPPTVTAFGADESVNHEATAAHARFVVEHGASGVFPLGTNGEFPLLTATERRAVVETVVEAIDEVPVLAGVGAPSTRETVAHAEHAAETGADGVIVVTPFYYALDREGAVEHYRRVADAVDVPVYIYQIPHRTGNELALETLDAVAEIDGIAGLKDSRKSIPWLGQAIDRNPELTFLAGSDSLVYAGHEVGCTGVVSAVANAFPELVVDCYEAAAAGDDERARELQSQIYDVRRALKAGPHMAGVKAALSIREVGFDPGPLRSPLHGMTDTERATLEETLTDLGMLSG